MGIAKQFSKQAAHAPEVTTTQKRDGLKWTSDPVNDASVVPLPVARASCHPSTASSISNTIFDEASKLKLSIQKSHRKKTSRFSFSTMKRVVVPPVAIPPELTHWTITETRVGGKEIPMTMRQHNLKKYHMSKRVPECIHE